MYGDWCERCLSYTEHFSKPCKECGDNMTVCTDCMSAAHIHV
jgi:hypothetical protein